MARRSKNMDTGKAYSSAVSSERQRKKDADLKKQRELEALVPPRKPVKKDKAPIPPRNTNRPKSKRKSGGIPYDLRGIWKQA